MTPWEQQWALDVLAAFAPPASDGLSPLPGEVDYGSTFRRMQRGATPLASFGLRLALWMVVLSPLWLLGRFATFSRLALRERTELLARLLRHTSSGVRELSLLLKFTAAVALLGTPSVRARSGYDSVKVPAPTQQQIAEGARRHLPVVQKPAARGGQPGAIATAPRSTGLAS
jgi:hypothetical protein